MNIKRVLVLALLVVAAINRSDAQAGALDPTFGTNGHVQLGQTFIATTFHKDGKFVGIRNEGSQLLVYQYLANGSPDPAFGIGGVTVVSSLSADARALSVAVGGDGKVMILNSLNPVDSFSRVALVRLNTTGAPDAAFGNNGIAINNLGPKGHVCIPNKVGVASNGEIIVSFEYQYFRNGYFNPWRRTFVDRYSVNGVLLAEGAGNGFIVTAYESVHPAHVPTELAIRKDGRILIGGSLLTVSFATTSHSTIVQFNPNATLDLLFNGFGAMIIGPSDDTVKSIAVNDLTGAIVFIGTANKVRAYDNQGLTNLTFGTSGEINTAIPGNKILFQNDNKIITGGSLNGDFAIARYDSSGNLDALFGNGGIITSDFGGNEAISDMIIVGTRLFAYGNGKLAVYDLSENPDIPIVRYNTVFGAKAFAVNTTGIENTAIGGSALPVNTTGSGNSSFGFNSMYGNTTGVYNTAAGYAALAQSVEGTSNVAVGLAAGYSNSNYSSTFISTLTNATVPVYNSTALGFQAIVNASNQVRIGNSGVTSIGGFTNWTNLSDGRFKKSVNDDVTGLAFITKLRPVTYTLDVDAIDAKLKTNIAGRQGAAAKGLSIVPPTAEELKAKAEKASVRYTGFVAQEVEQAAKKLGFDFSGVDVPKDKDGYYGLRYDEFVMPLVKAVQEQQKRIAALREQVLKLSNQAPGNYPKQSNH